MKDEKKYLILSDTHLGHVFDRRKFLFLQQIINNCDQVIINGDFWEGYLSSFYQFISSPWQELFPLLKKKQAIYIYGNHDPQTCSDARCNYFSVKQANSVTIKSGNKNFLVEHGHRLAPGFGGEERFMPKILLGLSPLFEAKNIRLPAFNFNNNNNKTKRWIAKNLPKEAFLIVGHSHRPELNHDARFANSGTIKWHKGTYLTIQNGQVKLHSEKY